MSRVQGVGYFFLMLISVTILAACGSVQHQVSLDEKFAVSPEMKIEVGKVSNECGESFDIDIEEMLTSAFATELEEKAMLWSGEPSSKLTLETKIIEYKKGDAFKRWLMPGWGATVLTIQCDLREGDKIVGTVEARRSVSSGGGYTIGAWKNIFASIAKDVVEDLEAQIKKEE